MPLETATYIADLNVSNPASSDLLAQTDDHLRLLKSVLKNSFPNVGGPTDVTDETLTGLETRLVGLRTDITSLQSLTTEWATATNRVIPPGFIAMWGGSTAPSGWLLCNGAAHSRTGQAALYGVIGTTYGVGDGVTTFNVPNFNDRYPRGASGTNSVGTVLVQMVLAHSHTATAATSGTVSVSGSTNTTGDHYHAAGIYDPGHIHSIDGPTLYSNIYAIGAGGPPAAYSSNAGSPLGYSCSTASTGVRVSSNNGIDTTYSAGSHSHSVTASGSISAATSVTVQNEGGAENRPNSLVVNFIIKT